MSASEIIIIVMCAVLICIGAALIALSFAKKNDSGSDAAAENMSRELRQMGQSLQMSTEHIKNMGELISQNQQAFSKSQSEKSQNLERRLEGFSASNEQKLENIRQTVDDKLEIIRKDNMSRLDEMRRTVDEKLQKTLEEKMNKSFSLVNERLEQVYKGLGEMQGLAAGVGDLKKVLSNVKTRGILGEIQLGTILSEILSPEQYKQNVATKKGSKNVVEFAVKLPGTDGETVYLPIDSKFPGDTYAALRSAADEGDKEALAAAEKALVRTLKSEAKDIHDKYIDPPNTTEFAIMFLPFEGLYCEAVNRGLVEMLQREYKVNIAGPATMAALLNSLQMGFKTLAVQKRSAEVWQILGEVKTEFDKFGDVLAATQMRLDQANSELDKLVGVRTRQIQKKLQKVESTEPV